MGLFRDRVEAGQKLAQKLGKYAGRDDVIVLALPRGGVPVARQSRAMNAPLDVSVAIGPAGQEELAIGAMFRRGAHLNEGWWMPCSCRLP
jgi:putative phosphoribosyl transferase